MSMSSFTYNLDRFSTLSPVDPLCSLWSPWKKSWFQPGSFVIKKQHFFIANHYSVLTEEPQKRDVLHSPLDVRSTIWPVQSLRSKTSSSSPATGWFLGKAMVSLFKCNKEERKSFQIVKVNNTYYKASKLADIKGNMGTSVRSSLNVKTNIVSCWSQSGSHRQW